jgi:hypothetical protein
MSKWVTDGCGLISSFICWSTCQFQNLEILNGEENMEDLDYIFKFDKNKTHLFQVFSNFN